MKTCPTCAEQIQTDARKCRYCGHEFSGADVEKARRAAGNVTLFKVWPWIVLLALLVWLCSPSENAGSSSTDMTKPVAAVDPKPCNELLERAEDAGLMRRRPSANRIDVEDLQWAAFPAESKRGLLLALRCSSLNGQPGGAGDYAVAYGYRSGKRLAMATSVGVSFE